MFGWLKVKKSPRGLKKPHNNYGGKIWFSLVKNVNISRQLCSDWLKMWHSPWIFFVILHQNVMRFCHCFHISWGPTTDFTTKELSLPPLVERAILTITSSIISFIIRYIVWLRRRLLHEFPLSKVSWEYVYLHCNNCFEK